MVRRVPCNKCSGNKVVSIKASDGRDKTIRCPNCSGEGYRIEVALSGPCDY